MLVAHILAQPPAAALPCNLTDEWLDLISHDLEGALGEDAPEDIDVQLLATPLALVVHILVGQHGETGQAWSFEALFDRLQDYRVEIALELLNRRTGVHTNPATMATIFKQREVIALLANVDRSYYGKLERGERQPSLALMLRIASGLGIPASELLGRVEKQLVGHNAGR